MDFPWAALITGLCTLAASYLANRAAQRRTFLERQWDFRRQAYAEIIGAVERMSSAAIDGATAVRDFRAAGDVSARPEFEKKLEGLAIAGDQFAKVHAEKSFMVSEPFLTILMEMRSKLPSAVKELESPDSAQRLSHLAREIRVYLPRLMEAARSDMNRS